ncbi:MAG: hypothetical protein ACXWRU_18810 [Pseudobdellovibrionaceae bacterium]
MDRSGEICAVAFTGDTVDANGWEARVISAQKANTANAKVEGQAIQGISKKDFFSKNPYSKRVYPYCLRCMDRLRLQV